MVRFLKFFVLVITVLAFSTFIYKTYSFAEEGGQNTSVNADDSNSSTAEDVSPTVEATPTLLMSERKLNKTAIKEAKQRNLEINKELKARKLEAKTKNVEKLTEDRLKLCEERSVKIKSRLDSSTNIGLQNHNRLQAIVVIVDTYYTEKLVPNNHVLSNYVDLKAAIDANNTNVQTLLDSAKASAAAFDCASTDPKGELENFRTDMKNLIVAEKTYRESVHAFVKAVKTLVMTPTVTPAEASITPAVPSVTVEPTIEQ